MSLKEVLPPPAECKGDICSAVEQADQIADEQLPPAKMWEDLNELQRTILDTHAESGTFIRPSLVRALNGNAAAALLACQLILESKGATPEGGWFECRQEKIEFLTGLGEDAQRSARKLLRAVRPRRSPKGTPPIRLLEERRVGNPARLEYRLDLGSLAALLQPEIRFRKGKGRQPTAPPKRGHSAHPDPVHGRDQDSGHGQRSMVGLSPIRFSKQYTPEEKGDDAIASSGVFLEGVQVRSHEEENKPADEVPSLHTRQRQKKTLCPEPLEFLKGDRVEWARNAYGVGPATVVRGTFDWFRSRRGKGIRSADWEEDWKLWMGRCGDNKPAWWFSEPGPACLREDWWPYGDDGWSDEDNAEFEELWAERWEMALENALRNFEDGHARLHEYDDKEVEAHLKEIDEELRDLGWEVAQALAQEKAAGTILEPERRADRELERKATAAGY